MGEDAVAGQVLAEDPLDDGCGVRIGGEPAQVFAFGALAGLGCRPRSMSVEP
jgi:hypothetical protein